MKVDDVEFSGMWHVYPWLFHTATITINAPLPYSILLECIGRPIVEVIKGHPEIDAKCGPYDIIDEAYLDSENKLSILSISHKLENRI